MQLQRTHLSSLYLKIFLQKDVAGVSRHLILHKYLLKNKYFIVEVLPVPPAVALAVVEAVLAAVVLSILHHF